MKKRLDELFRKKYTFGDEEITVEVDWKLRLGLYYALIISGILSAIQITDLVFRNHWNPDVWQMLTVVVSITLGAFFGTQAVGVKRN